MKKLILTALFYLIFAAAFCQTDSLEQKRNTLFRIDLEKIKENLSESEDIISEASYKGGMNNFYNYFTKNFNFNNVTLEDIPKAEQKSTTYMLYLMFTINNEGKPIDFKPVNTTVENSFYKESVRVITSSRWIPAKTLSGPVKRIFTIPVRVYIEDLK